MMKLALLFLALLSISPAQAAKTQAEFGVDRTVSPWQFCAYDQNMVCQPVFSLTPTSGGPIWLGTVGLSNLTGLGTGTAALLALAPNSTGGPATWPVPISTGVSGLGSGVSTSLAVATNGGTTGVLTVAGTWAGVYPEAYGAVGNGSADDTAAIASACSAAASAGQQVMFTKTYALAGALTCAAKMAFVDGAYLASSTNQSLAAPYVNAKETAYIFRGSATYTLTAAPVVNVSWWGASVLSDAAVAIRQAAASNRVVNFLPGASYQLCSTVAANTFGGSGYTADIYWSGFNYLFVNGNGATLSECQSLSNTAHTILMPVLITHGVVQDLNFVGNSVGIAAGGSSNILATHEDSYVIFRNLKQLGHFGGGGFSSFVTFDWNQHTVYEHLEDNCSGQFADIAFDSYVFFNNNFAIGCTGNTVTVQAAGSSPLFNWAGGSNPLYTGIAGYLDSSGTLPGGFSANTLYYVSATGLSSTQFELSATLGGGAITPSTAGTGTIQFTAIGIGGQGFSQIYDNAAVASPSPNPLGLPSTNYGSVLANSHLYGFISCYSANFSNNFKSIGNEYNTCTGNSAGALGVGISLLYNTTYSVGSPITNFTSTGDTFINTGVGTAGTVVGALAAVTIGNGSIANSDVMSGIQIINDKFINNANTCIYSTSASHISSVDVVSGNLCPIGGNQTTFVSAALLPALKAQPFPVGVNMQGAAVAALLGPNAAIRDLTDGSSTLYFDVSGGGYTNGAFTWRSSISFTTWLNLNATGLGTASGLPILSSGLVQANSYHTTVAALPTLSSCGTGSPVAATGSSAQGGQFTVGGGTIATCTVTFSVAWPTYAFCTISPANAAAAGATILPYVSASSKTAFTVTSTAASMAGATFNYECNGN
jgi:hypothetical protein